MEVPERLKVGSVPYLVARPLDLGLGQEPSIELVHDVPARLVEGLRAGRIDVALVSSIELFRRPGYRFLAGPAVAGRGFVSSVQVFLRGEHRPESLESLALDPASRTAATLVRVELAARRAQEPRYVEVAPDEDPRAAATDAWLRIGDAALREHFAPDSPPVFNPSAAWAERTGLPFVFAVWVVRPDVAVERWVDAFRHSWRRGMERVEPLAREAAEAWHIEPEDAVRYLVRECLYEPGESLVPALRAFRDAASALDLCRADLMPDPVPVPRPF